MASPKDQCLVLPKRYISSPPAEFLSGHEDKPDCGGRGREREFPGCRPAKKCQRWRFLTNMSNPSARKKPGSGEFDPEPKHLSIPAAWCRGPPLENSGRG